MLQCRIIQRVTAAQRQQRSGVAAHRCDGASRAYLKPSRESLILAASPSRESLLRDPARLGQPGPQRGHAAGRGGEVLATAASWQIRWRILHQRQQAQMSSRCVRMVDARESC